MLSAWSNADSLRAVHRQLPRGTLVSALLVLLLVLCVANSTVAAAWVPHSEVLSNLAVLAMIVMGGLAVLRFVPWPLALGFGLLATPLAAYGAAYPALHAAHPSDPGD